jgi:asparagine synthase (glutamine-hydrolysing)
LSIVDAAGGHQPMERSESGLVLVYNGEIYNFRELRSELIAAGCRLNTNSDTEVILASYEMWGRACVDRFIGMFSFALWDGRKELLWVVRDRLGIKPLYFWTGSNGEFACSSEIGPILELGLVRPELNTQVLDAYFTLGYVPAPQTMFLGIRKLEPGHELMIDRNGVTDRVYWDCAALAGEKWTEREAREHLDPLLQDAVRRCLVSDVPVGAFLSGGLDSSAVVALMNECGAGPVPTFTAGFSRPGETCESAWAKLVANSFECRHTLVDLAPSGFLDSIDALVCHSEEPLVEPSGIALHALAKAARPDVTVMLSGEGADEIFGGYGLYRRMLMIDTLRERLPGSESFALPQFLTRRGSDTLLRYTDWIGQPLEKRYRGTSAFLTAGLRERFYHPAFAESAGSYLDDTFESHFARLPPSADPLSRMLYVDMRTWLVDDLLLKADKMTMAASVELRVPFLDHRLVECAFRAPSSLKIRRNEGKWILKRMMESRLPKNVIWRRKMGFPVPLKKWFQAELRPLLRDHLLDENSMPWIRRDAITDLIENDGARTESRTRFLMTLLILSAWQRKYL